MFMMFKVGDDKKAAQLQMASDIEDPAFQSSFNVVKGSAPARTDVPDTAFDDCGKKAIKDLAEANEKGTLYGSMSQGYGSPAAIKNAMFDVITREYNGDIDPTEAAKELADAVAAAKGRVAKQRDPGRLQRRPSPLPSPRERGEGDRRRGR